MIRLQCRTHMCMEITEFKIPNRLSDLLHGNYAIKLHCRLPLEKVFSDLSKSGPVCLFPALPPATWCHFQFNTFALVTPLSGLWRHAVFTDVISSLTTSLSVYRRHFRFDDITSVLTTSLPVGRRYFWFEDVTSGLTTSLPAWRHHFWFDDVTSALSLTTKLPGLRRYFWLCDVISAAGRRHSRF